MPIPQTEDSTLFDWQPDWSVGIPVLDEDHKGFLTLSRLLFEAEREADNSMVVESAILLLQEYIGGHFLREETALRAAGFPQFDSHLARHVQFRNDAEAIIDRFHRGDDTAAPYLARLTAEWLVKHILHEDMQYKGVIRDEHVDDRPLGCLVAVDDQIDDDIMDL